MADQRLRRRAAHLVRARCVAALRPLVTHAQGGQRTVGGPGAAPVLQLAAGLPAAGDPRQVPRPQRRGGPGSAACAPCLPGRGAQVPGRCRKGVGAGDDSHRQGHRPAVRRRPAVLRRRGAHLGTTTSRTPDLGTAGRSGTVGGRGSDVAGDVVSEGQLTPAQRCDVGRPLRHSRLGRAGPARRLPRRDSARHGLRLAGRPGLPAWPDCSGGRSCRSTPARPTWHCHH